jgi:uncharacterized protein YbjT (DUF2867 family)
MLDHRGASRTYVVAAPQAYSFHDVAAALGAIAGTTVAYTPVTDDEYLAAAGQAGTHCQLEQAMNGAVGARAC